MYFFIIELHINGNINGADLPDTVRPVCIVSSTCFLIQFPSSARRWPWAWRAIVRYRRLAGVCGQYALGLAGARIAAEGEVRGPSSPRWSCARWTARTGLRRRRRSSCRSAITPSTRATSSSTRCRRRWSIATDVPRADDCSARQRTWTVFPTAITSRSVLSPEDRLRGDAAASSALDNRGILSRGLRDANPALWLLESLKNREDSENRS